MHKFSRRPTQVLHMAMTDPAHTDWLARQVLHWRVGPDRFLIGARSWIPKWRFCPTRKIEDAVRLLHAADPRCYTVKFRNGLFRVQVELKHGVGRASGDSLPRTIVLAIERALPQEARR
jgi:hypothetical protein